MRTSRLVFPLVCVLLIVAQPEKKVSAQHPEIGFTVVLSGALMFGPYCSYWLDDHNALNASILAAWEEEFIVPFALNAGYSHYFLDQKWRPELGLQYSYLISPRRHKSPDDPNGISLLSLVPGVQYRWDKTHQSVQSRIWVAYFMEKRYPGKKVKIFPIGLEFTYAYKFP
jgi:hypothetical protein